VLSVEHIRATVAIRLGAWCGIAGPIGFTLAWLGLGAAWPDYDPRNRYISELAASDAPHGVAMVAAFVALGVLMLVFARVLRRALGTGAAALGVALLIYIFGGTSIVSGLARCDPGCGGSSLTNQTHTVSTHIGLGALVLATLLLPWATRPDRRWRTFGVYSWLTGLVATAIFALDFATFGGVGTGQRLFVSLLFLWLVLVARRIQRLGPVQPQPWGAGDGAL
jgi:hypothetical membrane protein